MIEQLFAAWTVYGAALLPIQGVIFGEIVWHLRLVHSARALAWLATAYWLAWFVITTFRLATDHEASTPVLRQVGVGLQFLTFAAIACTVYWIEERRARS